MCGYFPSPQKLHALEVNSHEAKRRSDELFVCILPLIIVTNNSRHWIYPTHLLSPVFPQVNNPVRWAAGISWGSRSLFLVNRSLPPNMVNTLWRKSTVSLWIGMSLMIAVHTSMIQMCPHLKILLPHTVSPSLLKKIDRERLCSICDACNTVKVRGHFIGIMCEWLWFS